MALFALVADYGLFPDCKIILFVNRRFLKIFLLLYHITDKFSTQRRKKIDLILCCFGCYCVVLLTIAGLRFVVANVQKYR